MRSHTRFQRLLPWASLVLIGVACVSQGSQRAKQQLWWAGLGPVLPHDTFPADCSLCHEGSEWASIREDFAYDHLAETGVPLEGSHAQAACLLCHNDRGPVRTFSSRGCGGCHEDVHFARLGSTCERCHRETSWDPVGQVELHQRTRFPLVGVHASTACHRCHPGAEVGQFVPTDTECVTCHRSDLANALNPNHLGLGWVDRCDRCHLPRSWDQAESNP